MARTVARLFAGIKRSRRSRRRRWRRMGREGERIGKETRENEVK
jgi:hypothetical protein